MSISFSSSVSGRTVILRILGLGRFCENRLYEINNKNCKLKNGLESLEMVSYTKKYARPS